MALATFTPPIPPSPGTKTSRKLRILTVEFGDGYTQETRDGLNHIRKSITLEWKVLLPADLATIDTFFTTQGGDTPFYYTPSDESTPIKWTCKDWSDTRDKAGMRGIRATLEQSFSLLT